MVNIALQLNVNEASRYFTKNQNDSNNNNNNDNCNKKKGTPGRSLMTLDPATQNHVKRIAFIELLKSKPQFTK